MILSFVSDFFYEKIILNKETNRPRVALKLAREVKAEVISDNSILKSYLPLFVDNYNLAINTNMGAGLLRQEKNNQQKGFVIRFLNSR